MVSNVKLKFNDAIGKYRSENRGILDAKRSFRDFEMSSKYIASMG